MSIPGRAAALEVVDGAQGDLADAVRHALGAPGVRIGKTTAPWIAAARARAPGEDDAEVERAHPKLGPGAGLAGRFSHRVGENTWQYREREKTRTARHSWPIVDRAPAMPPAVPPLHLPVLLHTRDPDGDDDFWNPSVLVAGGDPALIRWSLTLWPCWNEPIFAEGIERLGTNLDWSQASWADRHYLDPLVEPTTPLRPMALLLLAIGLAAKEPGQSGLAIDALIAAIEEGRLDPDAMADCMASLLPTGLIKAARWAATLGQVARASPTHGVLVARVIQGMLRGDPKQARRDIGGLLELLRELLVEHSMPLRASAAIAYLQPLVGSSKTGKLAAALIALCPR